MPEPSKKAQGEIPDKFDSFTDLFKDRRDMSAMQEIDREELLKDDFESIYTQEEKAQIDSLNRVIADANRKKSYSYSPPKQQQKPISLKTQTDEMENFKRQILFIDSLTSTKNIPIPSSNNNEQDLLLSALGKAANKLENEQPENVQTMTRVDPNHTGFNTIMPDAPNQVIQAILDEGLKVYEGSRIKIRVLNDITIGEHLLNKNTILYGIVSGFTSQRVKINIRSIFLNGDIIPVNISVFDTDGMEGIYVPANTFREFTTEMGARGAQGGNQLRVQQEPQSQNAFIYSMLDNSIRTATQATSKEIRRKKAHFKYSTHVYLIDNSQ
jgi:conjugative transposon TraM protein